MIVFIKGKEISHPPGPLPEKVPAVYFLTAEEAPEQLKKMEMHELLLPLWAEGDASRFESHRAFDCIFLAIPDKKSMHKPLAHVNIFITGNDLVFVYQPCPVMEKLIAFMRSPSEEDPKEPQRVLYLFFNTLTEKDSAFLQDIEEEVAALEDALADDKELNYTNKISRLRKRLLQWKRYYESLFDLLVDLEENQNHFFTRQQLHYMHIITNRADRLTRAVMNLRDYVTQVREAYQAQIDISLNKTMQLFTVVTTIFLPLSLIAGWYGMNLQMPEYAWPFAYPAVVLLCVGVVVGCIWYFKRHKWF